MQIQISSTLDSEIREHMTRLGYTSKNDFIIEVILEEWIFDNKQKLIEFKKRMNDENL